MMFALPLKVPAQGFVAVTTKLPKELPVIIADSVPEDPPVVDHVPVTLSPLCESVIVISMENGVPSCVPFIGPVYVPFTSGPKRRHPISAINANPRKNRFFHFLSLLEIIRCPSDPLLFFVYLGYITSSFAGLIFSLTDNPLKE